jgi:hypothetical protein
MRSSYEKQLCLRQRSCRGSQQETERDRDRETERQRDRETDREGKPAKMKREATVVLTSIVHQTDAFERRERYIKCATALV